MNNVSAQDKGVLTTTRLNVLWMLEICSNYPKTNLIEILKSSLSVIVSHLQCIMAGEIIDAVKTFRFPDSCTD